MTQHEQSLADDKMRAEIARLLTETANLMIDSRKKDDRARAEIAKLLAETRQIGVNTFLAPALAAAALMGATAALVKLFF